MDTFFLSRLRQAIHATGFPVHGVVDMVHWRQRLSSPDAATRDKGREALLQAIKDSHAIGGSSVLLVPGRVSGKDETHDHVWKRSIVEIRKVLPLASRLGIHVLIENVWSGFCEDPKQYRDYIDEINSPWVGAYFDIGNCRKFGPAEDWIRTLGRRIVKLDVKDWGRKNSFCRLSEGDVNWPVDAERLAFSERVETGQLRTDMNRQPRHVDPRQFGAPAIKRGGVFMGDAEFVFAATGSDLVMGFRVHIRVDPQ